MTILISWHKLPVTKSKFGDLQSTSILVLLSLDFFLNIFHVLQDRIFYIQFICMLACIWQDMMEIWKESFR